MCPPPTVYKKTKHITITLGQIAAYLGKQHAVAHDNQDYKGSFKLKLINLL